MTEGNKLSDLDLWIRNRLHYCIWHHWKKPNKRMRSLIRLGKSPGEAYAWSRSRMGGWRVACSPILGTTITIKRLKQRGYIPFMNTTVKFHMFDEPPYTRPAWFTLSDSRSVRWCERCTGGATIPSAAYSIIWC